MIIAVIIARGGSKGVPRKNIVDFCGKPLVAWTIEQAIECPTIDEVYVSTEDNEIAEISRKYGAKVVIRPEEFSRDNSPAEPAIKHVIEQITNENSEKIDYVVLFQPSSPLKETQDITNAIKKIIDDDADSLFSGSLMEDLTTWAINNGKLESFSFDWQDRGMRKDRKKQIVENGAIYVFKPKVLYDYNNRLGGKITMSEMDPWKIHEIDTQEDLKLCSELFKLKLLPSNNENSGRVVWFNGKLISEKDAKVSIYDSALMFGDMVFEMTRSFNKKQFKLREHLERLYASIKHCQIPIKMTIDEMENAVYETIKANEPFFEENDEHRIMINVSRGLLSLYEGIEGVETGPNIIIADFPLKWTVVSMGHLYDTGISAVIPSQRAIPASLLEPKVKNRSRLHYLMANIEVSNYKGKDNWALLLDPDGFIAEGTGDNFFIVKNKTIITPEGRNILRGISRGYIFDLAKELNYKCIEKNIEPYDVYNADEAFMTGTPFCLLPVTKLNNKQIGDGKIGEITKILLDQWSKNVGVDIIKQIKDYEKKCATNSPSPYEFKKSESSQS